MMTPKDAAVKLTHWMGAQLNAGVPQDQLMNRIASDPEAAAAEIGIPVAFLSTDLFAHIDSNEILEAMVGAAVLDAKAHVGLTV